MTTTELRQRLRAAREGLAAFAEVVALATAQTALSVVKDRSIRDGIFVDGDAGRFVDYSENRVLTFRFKDRALNEAGRRYIKENPLGTWREFSEAQGRTKPGNRVNLSYSNRMWSSMGILRQGATETGFFVAIGSTDPLVRTYLGELAQRYGNFIRPTLEEQNELLRDAYRELRGYLLRTLRG